MAERRQTEVGPIRVYPRSVTEMPVTPKSDGAHQNGATYFLARFGAGKKVLCIRGDADGFVGERAMLDRAHPIGDAHPNENEVLVCPLTAENARSLAARLPWLRPVPLGLQTSAGCGDRLGLATPGHIRAVRKVCRSGATAATAGGVAPILAQQSMRENARTGRTPQEVMDDAMWGVFEEGWREPWGADADHLKTTADIDLCVAAGYTFFTIDPGDHVDNAAHTDDLEVLQHKFNALPWPRLHEYADAMRARYLTSPRGSDRGQNQDEALSALGLAFDEVSLLRAACKYGVALAHTAEMYEHLVTAKAGSPFELEVSVDETETPTSPLEHVFIATELSRLGVEWVSLAPRYVGRFEKGVDYIGDLRTFDAEFAGHAAIARAMGPYKLSIHSGSDKFSIYPSMARHTRGVAHLKTAGTSYLEALRAVAKADPVLFREILTLARERYGEDRASYHVSADVAKVPDQGDLTDAALPGVLDLFDGREVLHVTFGSILAVFGERLKAVLDANEEVHYDALEVHFVRHLTPFAGVGARQNGTP
ncbi:MAG: tagaturonate epimerase family protein [Anaerolineae bacterium]|nr:tagaturonate epimerase family protein [Anaerolineae bacterium]